MISFDFQPRTRIIFGPNRVDQLGTLAGEMGTRRALVVSDPGIVKAGHTERGIKSLKKAGIESFLFSDVHENPSTDDVDRGLKFALRHEPELIVGLGGGSSMDCAKGINFVYTNGGTMHDYWGVGKALKEMLPMIAIPTTAGTGSETQSFALISDAKSHVKMACGDKKASFRAAILDPTLTVTQPDRVTALTGIDAIAHAIETYVTKPRNSVSLSFSREAWRLLAKNFIKVLREPSNLEARGEMQLGACFAGMAIENSMLGAAHALANPLTAKYGIVHGQAVGLMLPHVVRFNGEQFGDWYVELAGVSAGASDVESLAKLVTSFLTESGLAIKLSDLNVDRNLIPQLAEAASEQWTGNFNPRPVDPQSLQRVYEAAF
ncbi:MAG: iron-containing alcohol dehydrogenase [Planctomycetales bacterium]|nr:iron-containing alcohol dehydrogenase [Planctomycetales bacterium]